MKTRMFSLLIACSTLIVAGTLTAEEVRSGLDPRSPAGGESSLCGGEGAVRGEAGEAADLESLAAQLGMETVAAEEAAAAPACPAILSCNATHCIETSLCAVTDTGSSTCCTGFGCLICPPGTTVKIKRCRCAGGGCLIAASQTFFCG